jgi:hypothetical protein
MVWYGPSRDAIEIRFKKNSADKAQNGFCYSAGKNAPFMKLSVSWNSQFQGSPIAERYQSLNDRSV